MFLISEIRAEAEAAATAFAAAGDIDALLDVYEVMVAIDLNLAHWQAAARWAQLGLKLAAATGLDQRREDFTTSWSNAMVWGSSDARESLAIHDELLASTSRRLTRVWIVSGVAILWAVLGDRDRAEAAHDEATSLADELGIRPSEFRRAYMRFVLDDLTAAIQLARQESANLERVGETGRRSTIVGLEAWILALIGDDAEAARAAEESRRLGAADDAVTQILWRSAMGVVLARRGETIEADRVTTELVDIADGTDSMDAGTAWLARGWVLSMAGRREESAEAARRARELFAAKGFVNGIRRVEALLGG
jgi:tetratricopeptide (TPR) repeat protein